MLKTQNWYVLESNGKDVLDALRYSKIDFDFMGEKVDRKSYNYFQSAQRRIKVDSIELTSWEEQRRTALVHKLTQGTISLTEAHELRTLLQRERHMLTQQGNCLAFFAARFLVDFLDEYLQSKSNSLLTSSET